MKPNTLALTGVLLGSLVGLSGCSSTTAPATAPSAGSGPTPPIAVATLRGAIVTSGGPVGTPAMRWPGTVTILGADGSVTTAETGETGRFEIQLAPGDYTVTATSPNYTSGAGSCATQPAVTTLRTDAVAEVQVVCSIK